MAKKTQTLEEIFHLEAENIDYSDKISIDTTMYYENVKNRFEDIFGDDKNYDIIAPTGSGKTFAIIKFAKLFKAKILLFVPYEINVRQLGDKHRLTTIYQLRKNELDESLHEIIVSTFDGIKFLSESAEIDLNEYILVIDEFHNYFLQLDLRGEVIMETYKNLSAFAKVITITGTPQGIYNPSDYDQEDRQVISFVPTEEDPIIETKIVLYGEKLLQKLLIHLNEKNTLGKVIIYWNDKDKLEELKLELLDQGFSEDEIAIINKDTKLESSFNDIIQKEKVNNNLKFVLCTMLIADGVNIDNEDIGAIYILNERNLMLLRQFYRRFRKFSGELFDFIPGNDISFEKVDWPSNYYNNITRSKGAIEALSYKYNEILSEFDKYKSIDNYFIDSFLNKFKNNDFMYFDVDDWKMYPSIFKVTASAMSIYFNISYSDSIANRMEYLNSFEKRINMKSRDFVDMRSEYVESTFYKMDKEKKEVILAFIEQNIEQIEYYIWEHTLIKIDHLEVAKPISYDNFIINNSSIIHDKAYIKILSLISALKINYFLPLSLIVKLLPKTSNRNLKLTVKRLAFLMRRRQNEVGIGLGMSNIESNRALKLFEGVCEFIENKNPISKDEVLSTIKNYIETRNTFELGNLGLEPTELWNYLFLIYSSKRSQNTKKFDEGKRRKSLYKFTFLEFEDIFSKIEIVLSKEEVTYYNHWLNNMINRKIKNGEK